MLRLVLVVSASEMTYIVSSGALNSTHSLVSVVRFMRFVFYVTHVLLHFLYLLLPTA